MPKPKPRDIPDIRVDDAEAAFHKLEDFTRRILAVPKAEIHASVNEIRHHGKRKKK